MTRKSWEPPARQPRARPGGVCKQGGRHRAVEAKARWRPQVLTAIVLDWLEVACRAVPPARNTYLATDLVCALVETVLDYQQHTTTGERAMRHFPSRRHAKVRSLADLQDLLARFPDDQDRTGPSDALGGLPADEAAPRS